MNAALVQRMNRAALFLLVLVAAFLVAASANAEELRGRVVGIVDGDTLDLLTAGKETVRLRLHGIDAPEAGQAYGTAAKAYTASRAAGADVVAQVVSRDRWGRAVVDVALANGESLNRALVGRGLAWWAVEYAPQDKELERLEAEARAARRGLWADLNTARPPVRPQDFRKPKGNP